MPIPADTIVGLYHPYRDVVWNGLTAGVPFKNFLITDAVRQQYPWRKLAFDVLKKGQYPGWNPYTHAGTPLAANIQTALFNPLNILYLLFPFNLAWTFQVMSQPILLSLFMYLYLRKIGRSKEASLLASLVLSFCGFSIAWLEWNTTLHTLVWLPASLLAIENILEKSSQTRWYLLLVFALSSILFAGFLQTAFYIYTLIAVYILFRIQSSENRERRSKLLSQFFVLGVLVLAITSIQWLPTIRFIQNSARSFDQGNVLGREDWFIPWQHLVQFIAPDFFGNPATLNYWGVFNYVEYIGYIGVVPLIFVLLGLRTKEDKHLHQKRFFIFSLLTALLFATNNFIARIPFHLHIPLISTAQPSRLMVIIDFSLAVLAAFGVDWFLSNLINNEMRILLERTGKVVGLLLFILFGLWTITFVSGGTFENISPENLHVAQRNLILPSGFVLLSSIILFGGLLSSHQVKKRKNVIQSLIFTILFLITVADLFRFAWKFTPFSNADYLYPKTEVIKFLEKDQSVWRYMTTDRRIIAPNFSISHKFQTIEGYDPIYLKRYGQLIATAQRGQPTLDEVEFHRIIRPDNFESPIYDLLNVKYILALRDIDHSKLQKVFQEGETRVYENMNVLPRAFILPDYQDVSEMNQLSMAFEVTNQNIRHTAQITSYEENEVELTVEDDQGGMLVLADVYYPGWSVTIDGSPAELKPMFHALRGTIIPSGRHEVIYRYSQL